MGLVREACLDGAGMWVYIEDLASILKMMGTIDDFKSVSEMIALVLPAGRVEPFNEFGKASRRLLKPSRSDTKETWVGFE